MGMAVRQVDVLSRILNSIASYYSDRNQQALDSGDEAQ
jgi:hypothetical protein